MFDGFLYVGLPYVAFVIALVGSILRVRDRRFGISALSSQFLESRRLRVVSPPWHLGILVVLLGHLLALLFPGTWQTVVSTPAGLYTVEALGLGCAVLAMGGLLLATVRRLRDRRLLAVSSPMDLALLGLLLAQVGLGITVALAHRWGAAWAVGTVVPYLWSLVLLQPDPATIADLPLALRLHVIGAWVFLLVFPFSRLVHALFLPIGYLWRNPQQVIWNNERRRPAGGDS